MSTMTLTPDADDFHEWEQQFEPTRRRPSKAALRRAADEEILRGLGIRRHRSHEREAF